MSTTTTGRDAEAYVASKLKRQGYTLIDQNWRTRWCEIDLVMTKSGTVYFIEVKYRSSDRYGSGFEYITAKKQQQMRFAGEMWLAQHKWDGEAVLCGVEVGPTLDGDVELVELL